MARIANWVQMRHARGTVTPVEGDEPNAQEAIRSNADVAAHFEAGMNTAEQDAMRAVANNSADADALVQTAIRLMFEHSRTFREGERLVRLDPEAELQLLGRCVALYALRNEPVNFRYADPLMEHIASRGRAIHENKAVVRPGRGLPPVMDGEEYIQAVLWRRYSDYGRCPEGFELSPDVLIAGLQNVKPQTARVFLADPQIAEMHVPRSYQATIVKELTRQLESRSDLTAADHLRNEASAQGAARLVPAAHQPKLEYGKAVYDATGTLMENDVPTPDVVLQEIADFLSPRTPGEPAKSSGHT